MADRGPQQVQVHSQSQYGQKPGGPFGQPHRGGVFGGEHSQGPSAGKVLAVMALLPVGGTLLFLAGLTFVGTMIGLALSTPVFVIFSPVLVPAAVTIGLAVAGFLTSGAFGVTGLSSLSWVFNYFRRTSVPDQLDYAKRRAQDMVGFAGQKVKDMGQEVQTKAGSEGKRT